MTDSKQRFLETTARLLRERGYAATSMGDIVTESGAPKGSLYFHFPGGKNDLVAEALAGAGAETCTAIGAALTHAKTTSDAIEAVFAFLGAELERSNFRSGCPIGTVAAEAPESKVVNAAVLGAFVSWEAAIAASLVKRGVKKKRAAELATFVLTVVEGALVLAKAKHDLAPLDRAKKEIARMMRAEVAR